MLRKISLSWTLFLSPILLGVPKNLGKIESILPTFEQHIQKGMQENHIPGAAVAVIMDNQVVYIKGFGVRKEGEHELINPETVFQIASISKPIATTILAAFGRRASY